MRVSNANQTAAERITISQYICNVGESCVIVVEQTFSDGDAVDICQSECTWKDNTRHCGFRIFEQDSQSVREL